MTFLFYISTSLIRMNFTVGGIGCVLVCVSSECVYSECVYVCVWGRGGGGGGEEEGKYVCAVGWGHDIRT